MDSSGPFDLSFKAWLGLFLLGFLTKPFAKIGKVILNWLALSIGTTEVGYALIGGATLGFSWGLIEAARYTIGTLSDHTFSPFWAIFTPIADTLGGLALAFVVTVAHDFLELVSKFKSH